MPLNGAIVKPDCASDIGMDGIADFLTESMQIPSTFLGCEVSDDGYLYITENDIEKHFSSRFDRFKALAEKATLSDFCEGVTDSNGIMPIESLIEETFEVYVVDNYRSEDTCECAITLDAFLRRLYWEQKHNKGRVRYLVGCIGYHS